MLLYYLLFLSLLGIGAAVGYYYENILELLYERDDRKHYVPYKEGPATTGLRCGVVLLHHSQKKLRKASDKRGPGQGKVSLYYETTMGETQRSSKEHFLLLHATGSSGRLFHHGRKSLFDRLREAGHEVTTFDLRGHGRSSVPAGPYSIELFALDVAEALDKEFAEERFHVVGVSIGFGVAMALSLYHPKQIKTVCGNGFLYKRSRFDPLSAFASSNSLLPLLLGRPLVVWLGELAFGVTKPGILQEEFKHQKIKGVMLTTAGWTFFNTLKHVPGLKVPTLVIHPEMEWQVGNTKSRHLEEISLMPPGMGEYKQVPGHSHWMVLEPGGAEKYADIVLEFVTARLSASY